MLGQQYFVNISCLWPKNIERKSKRVRNDDSCDRDDGGGIGCVARIERCDAYWHLTDDGAIDTAPMQMSATTVKLQNREKTERWRICCCLPLSLPPDAYICVQHDPNSDCNDKVE